MAEYIDKAVALSMLDQMAIEFKVEDAVEELRAFKVRRLRERIDKNA